MWRKIGSKQGVLVCSECGNGSAPYAITSPAAPELSICEQAANDGWVYDLGFFAMLAGHNTKCPACVAQIPPMGVTTDDEAFVTAIAHGVEAYNDASGRGTLGGPPDCPTCLRPQVAGHHGCACT